MDIFKFLFSFLLSHLLVTFYLISCGGLNVSEVLMSWSLPIQPSPSVANAQIEAIGWVEWLTIAPSF